MGSFSTSTASMMSGSTIMHRPEPGPKDVVVKMKACGICGSDLSYIKVGGMPREPGGTTALGHEGAGEIMAVGSGVQGLSVGQAVIVNPMNTPSFIGSGGPEGAFTEELLVRDARLDDSILPIPEGIPYDVAAMCEPLAVALARGQPGRSEGGDASWYLWLRPDWAGHGAVGGRSGLRCDRA